MTDMTIADMHGNIIEIADLRLAIMQADDFRHYSTTQPEMLLFCLKQQAYWEDFYQKLLVLQQHNS